MENRVTMPLGPLGPLVALAKLEATLGPRTPEGDRFFFDCGCAARFDRGEGAWRYASACPDHAPEAQ